jgi:acetoin utilization deacetylase AcuC-like enzyme
VDLDVHQGNGTAEIFRSNPNVFTFPLMENHYPFKKKKLLDIAFNDNTTDDEFLQTIASDSEIIETQNLILSFI